MTEAADRSPQGRLLAIFVERIILFARNRPMQGVAAVLRRVAPNA
jgi:hypothetical protein